MSYQAKRELLIQIAPRYREANRHDRTVILDAFVAATGYDRKYAIRLLGQPTPSTAGPIKRPRPRVYGKEVQEALIVAWKAANCICAKRLVPFLPELVPSLEEHGHLALTDDVRQQLLALSPATADRILGDLRKSNRPRGATTTTAGKLLKHQVPVRTFADWVETEPGFFEGDLVAHCGSSVEGSFLWSLVMTDIATGWTECLALRYRGQNVVIDGLNRIRRLLPFPLLGFDTDNGSEFLNNALIAYCEREEITFTRGRARKKNDQCHIEQKNGSVVRQLVGYDRYEGEIAYRQLAELYRAVRLYVNFFQPSMKLLKKQRRGSRVQRYYDAAQTPLQRLLASDRLDEDEEQHLKRVFRTLDPVRLLQQIQTLQDALWRHAVQTEPRTANGNSNLVSAHVTFDVQACMPAVALAHNGGDPSLTVIDSSDKAAETLRKRKYRRTQKPRKPRTYRTRKDPFEAVKDELHAWFLEQPDITGKALLHKLQHHYPDLYPDKLLRTLQRRLQVWRKQVIFEFDDQLIREDVAITEPPAPQLRAVCLNDLISLEPVAA